MNTRVQVEHCVTEETTGVDIVREQILDRRRREARRSRRRTSACTATRSSAASTPRTRSKNFAPAPGTVAHYREPSGPGVRVDSGVVSGTEITPLYDPMVAKLIVWDADRERATRRMLRALEEYEIEGVKTLIPFHKAIMASEQWAKGETCRDLIEDKDVAEGARLPEGRRSADDDEPEIEERTYTVEVVGQALRRRRARRGDRRRRPRRRGRRQRRRPAGAPRASASPAAAVAEAATRSPRRCRATSGRCSSSRAPTSRRAR